MGSDRSHRHNRRSGASKHGRNNQSIIPAKRTVNEAAEEAWVAGEDLFVLEQAKKKAVIRVREGRARPIDWLATTLRVLVEKNNFLSVDDNRDDLYDGEDGRDFEILDPEAVFLRLTERELGQLLQDLETFCTLEQDPENRNYWITMKTICKDRQRMLSLSRANGRFLDGETDLPSSSLTSYSLYSSSGSMGPGLQNVTADANKLLASKSIEDLDRLEIQIRDKLASDQDLVDHEYWETLLDNIMLWKARAHLREISKAVINSRLNMLRKQQMEGSRVLVKRLREVLVRNIDGSTERQSNPSIAPSDERVTQANLYNDHHVSTKHLYTVDLYDVGKFIDGEPMLKLIGSEAKSLPSRSEADFLNHVAIERRNMLKLGYIPAKQKDAQRSLNRDVQLTAQLIGGQNGGSMLHNTTGNGSMNNGLITSGGGGGGGGSSGSGKMNYRIGNISALVTSRFAPTPGMLGSNGNDDFSHAMLALYEREVARGVDEDEEILNAEEEIEATKLPEWANKYKPRKPRYFNRVKMGYDWNKYNQTHFGHDNPPPRVPQGYKFNIFYPDLVDPSKAPTYRIERGGRKKGHQLSPAGVFDTCLIRFIGGPPYEDICFRIVDREWDYSAKRERAFRSSFEKVSRTFPYL